MAKKKAGRKKKVHFIPAGYHAVTPYLACAGAARAIAFYKKAFGAAELMRMPGPGGKVGHAEVKISDARIMLADEHPDMDFLSSTATAAAPCRTPSGMSGTSRRTWRTSPWRSCKRAKKAMQETGT